MECDKHASINIYHISRLIHAVNSNMCQMLECIHQFYNHLMCPNSCQIMWHLKWASPAAFKHPAPPFFATTKRPAPHAKTTRLARPQRRVHVMGICRMCISIYKYIHVIWFACTTIDRRSYQEKNMCKSNMGILKMLDFCCRQRKLCHRFPSEFQKKNTSTLFKISPSMFANKKITGYKFLAL